MPGTIHVSVLDLVGLESPLQQALIKVSMGKRDYQTFKNGDLYIPLTSLRDRLVVAVQVAEGNEVSHMSEGIETRLVIEKGIWDDLFPLQGGGFVHMRLQFVLSEEDRNRIRTTRELAMKKKHEELLNGKVKNPDSPDTNLQGGETVAQTGPVTTKPSMLVKDVKPKREDIPGTHSSGKLTNIDSDDLKNTSSTNPILSMPSVHEAEVWLDSLVGSSKCRNTPSDASLFTKPLPVAAASEKLPAKLNRHETCDLGNQRPKSKAPPHVRKMITAFESGINQDVKPKLSQPQMKSQSSEHGAENIKPKVSRPEMKSQSSKHGAGNSLKSSQFEARDKQTVSVRTVTGASHSVDNRHLEVQSSAAVGAEETNSHTEVSSEVSKRIPTNGRGYFPGIKVLELVIRRFPFINLFFQRHRVHHMPSKRIAVQNSEHKCIHGVSADWHEFQESSGFWMFADSRRHLCVTTGSKHLVNLMGHCLAEEKSGQREKFSRLAEDNEEGGKICNSPVEGERTSRGSERGNSSSRGEGSRGPVGQVMRIAIMAGFATLVLFTRQRTDR